ncbi:MAG: GtrA family protein [Candidatus Spechtbacteria bacterium]|nr:GtrA family protein [Candidatus Spechtbacteria bacterium]
MPNNENFKKSDLIGSALIGFFSSALFLLIAYTTVTAISHAVKKPPMYYWAALLVFPLLTSLGMIVLNDLKGKLLQGKFAVLPQFYKFVLVGMLNTLLDLSVLNALIVMSGISQGWHFSVFKGVSFAAAVVHSYFWNKFWTFGKKENRGAAEFLQFLLVSVAGLAVNVGIASFFVNVIGAKGGISPQLWANAGALAAIVFSTVWNFVGYKVFVFKEK